MKTGDLTCFALSNLWRTKLRTSLTTLGVIIGIGALVSMVSFGTGMQKNISDVFYKNDLFTSLFVSSKKVDIEEIAEGNLEKIAGTLIEPAPALNDSAITGIRNLSGVEIAFPQIRFPVKVRFQENETRAHLLGLPMAMSQYRPFNELSCGHFFSIDSEKAVILSHNVLKKLKIVLRNGNHFRGISLEDSIRGIRSMLSDSLLGKELELITSVIDVEKVTRNPIFALTFPNKMPFKETTVDLKIVGILKKPYRVEGSPFASGVIVPQKTAEKIPRLGFNSVWDLLGKGGNTEDYASVYVRVKDIRNLEPVKKAIEDMGFGVFALADQLREIRRGFLILDTILGAVGTIALIVAALGIINTMVMSIMERTREIGIMMAIGAGEIEIKGIFFFEAGTIGLVGGIFGLILGWIVTRIANVVANYYILKQGGSHVDLFYFPIWLILGALGFSILVSLLAGLYPAVRAARINPVEALRHD